MGGGGTSWRGPMAAGQQQLLPSWALQRARSRAPAHDQCVDAKLAAGRCQACTRWKGPAHWPMLRREGQGTEPAGMVHTRRGVGGVRGYLVGVETARQCARPPSIRRPPWTYGQEATRSARTSKVKPTKKKNGRADGYAGTQTRKGLHPVVRQSSTVRGNPSKRRQCRATPSPSLQHPEAAAPVTHVAGQRRYGDEPQQRPGRMASRRRAYRDDDHPTDQQRVVDRGRGGAEASTSATAADDDTDSSRSLSCAHRAAAGGSRLTPVAGPRRSWQKHETTRGAATRKAGGPAPGILHSTGTASRGA